MLGEFFGNGEMDMKRISARMLVIAALLLTFMLAMSFHHLPKLLHEVIGLLWLVLALLHVWQNRNWFKSLGRGKWTLFRSLNTLIDFAMLALLLVMVLAGTGISNHLFKDIMPLDIRRSITLQQLHVALPYALLILMGLHWGLHFKSWLGQWQRVLEVDLPAKAAHVLQCLLGSVLVAAGVYGSLQDRIGDRLLMKHIFATPATGESWPVYVALLAGVMGLYVLAGAAVKKILCK